MIFRLSFFVLASAGIFFWSARQYGLHRPFEKNSVPQWLQSQEFWLIAKKGGSGLAPALTEKAFRSTKSLSPKILLEVEIRRTLDGKWVLYDHDRLDVRTKSKGFVFAKKWKELKDLNMGFHFQDSQGRYSLRKGSQKDIRMLQFSEFLEKHKGPFYFNTFSKRHLRV